MSVDSSDKFFPVLYVRTSKERSEFACGSSVVEERCITIIVINIRHVLAYVENVLWNMQGKY